MLSKAPAIPCNWRDSLTLDSQSVGAWSKEDGFCSHRGEGSVLTVVLFAVVGQLTLTSLAGIKTVLVNLVELRWLLSGLVLSSEVLSK